MRLSSWAAAACLVALVCAGALQQARADGDSDTSDVVVLTDGTLADALKNNRDAGVLLEFYAPWCGHCKNLAPTYEKVATALSGQVTVAKVDATANSKSAELFGVKGYPTVVLAKGGQKYAFQGKRTVEDLVAFAKEGDETGEGEPIGSQEPEYDGPDHVIELTDATFEDLTQAASGSTTGDWLVMFYAPWCGHCKKLHPTFKAVAAELKGNVNVASVDATANMHSALRFGVRGYPTLKFFHNGQQFSYKGKRTKEALVNFATAGFREAEGEAVKPAPTALEAFQQELAAQWATLQKDLSTLMRFKKNALIVTFAAGAVAGVLLAFAMFACMGGLNPPPIQIIQAPAASSTPATATADGDDDNDDAPPATSAEQKKRQ